MSCRFPGLGLTKVEDVIHDLLLLIRRLPLGKTELRPSVLGLGLGGVGNGRVRRHGSYGVGGGLESECGVDGGSGQGAGQSE